MSFFFSFLSRSTNFYNFWFKFISKSSSNDDDDDDDESHETNQQKKEEEVEEERIARKEAKPLIWRGCKSYAKIGKLPL